MASAHTTPPQKAPQIQAPAALSAAPCTEHAKKAAGGSLARCRGRSGVCLQGRAIFHAKCARQNSAYSDQGGRLPVPLQLCREALGQTPAKPSGCGPVAGPNRWRAHPLHLPMRRPVAHQGHKVRFVFLAALFPSQRRRSCFLYLPGNLCLIALLCRPARLPLSTRCSAQITPLQHSGSIPSISHLTLTP